MEVRIVPIKVPLATKESQFLQIQQLINAKRDLLLNKQKKLKAVEKQNQFLNAIKEDYQKYNDYIFQQKKDQITALEIINNYINDLTETGKLSKYNIKDAKFEQNKILQEVNSIRSELDKIMEDTNYVSSKIKQKM
jgi:hypothetical protein